MGPADGPPDARGRRRSVPTTGKSHAQRLVTELGEGMDDDQPPSRLSDAQLMRIHNLFSEVKFDPPTGDTLSPAGEYNLRLGIMKEVSPVLIATHQGQPGVFQGHSFQIEVGVSIGGKDVKSGAPAPSAAPPPHAPPGRPPASPDGPRARPVAQASPTCTASRTGSRSSSRRAATCARRSRTR